MSDLRTSIILNMTGNLGTQSRKFGTDIHNMGQRGTRAISMLNRGLQGVGRGLDALGNRYTAFLFGAGGVGTIRMVGNLESRFTRLGIQANKSATDMQRLKKEIFETAQAPDIRIDPSELTAAIEEIVEKTGDLDFARANIRNFAAAIQATGADGLSIGGIAAEFQKMGLIDPKKVLEALDILTVQGKEGAFTLQNLASLGPRVVTAYTAMGRTGLPAIREMGAALQVIRQGTGSSEMAATAFEALMRTLGDASKVKLLQKGGIKVFDPESLKKGQQILRPINELMVDIIRQTKGRKTLLSNIFDAEAIRAFNSAASEFQRTGTVSSLDKFYNVNADGKTVMADSARAARDFNAALTNLGTAWHQFADTELSKPISDLANYLNSLEPGTVQRWMDIAKWVGILGGGAIFARKVMRFLPGASGKGMAGIPGMGGLGGTGGVVPVYVVNDRMSLLDIGGGAGGAAGMGAGGAAAGVSGLTATAAATGILALEAGVAYAVVKGIESGFKKIGAGQIKGNTGKELHDQLNRIRVMGDANGSAAKMIVAEMERRNPIPKAKWMESVTREEFQTFLKESKGELKIKIDSQTPVTVTDLRSKNMDISVDTGRTMSGPR